MNRSKVDLTEVQQLATEVRRAQSSLDAGVQGFSNARSAPSKTAFGNTDAGPGCLSAHQQAQSAMDSALKAFATTVNSDGERLESALALYRKTDAEAADNLLAANRDHVDVFSTQLSNSSTHHPEWNRAQDAEVQELRRLAGDPSQGNTVVAGDFNQAGTDNSSAAKDIRSFDGQGFNVHAGDIHDGPGGGVRGTTLHYYGADHVMTRGVGSSEAQRWARGQSDHDGQVVDTTLPSW